MTILILLVFATAATGQRPPPVDQAPVDPSPVDQAHANPFLPSETPDVGWPTIRGPDYDGFSAEIGLSDSWPEGGPPVLWVKDLGQGYSSFVVADNRAYTQYQTLAGQFVICLDASTGETLWRYRYDWPFETAGLYPGPRSTPTIAHGRIFFATPSGDLGCLSPGGKLLWRVPLKTRFDGKGTDFGYACAPIVVDNKVLMPVGGVGASMVAVDADDGSVLWNSGDASASYTPALPITVDGHRQVIGFLEHELAAFDLETGKLLWSQNLSRGYDEHSAWPIYHQPYLWTSAPFQAGSQLLELSGGENASYKRVWQSPILSNDVSSSVLVDGYLYGFDLAEAQSKAHRPSRGSFRCIDFLSGQPQWSNGDPRQRRSTEFSENAQSQTIGHASVLVADGKMLLFNDLGDLILARVDSQKYVELARTPALGGEITWAPPALDRGRVFLRNHSRAVCLYVGNPDLLSTIANGEVLTVSDIPQGAAIDLTRLLGMEPDYAMDPPTYRWLRIWFGVSLAILTTAMAIAALLQFVCRTRSTSQIRWSFWSIAMVLGVVTGTIASVASGDFVFTWPVTLFIAFQIVVYQSKIVRPKKLGHDDEKLHRKKWQDRIIALAFVAICVGYFLLCRRLSLVTEPVFLCGFAAACPLLLIGRQLSIRPQRRFLWIEALVTLLAFAAFFGSSVVLLRMNYELSPF